MRHRRRGVRASQVVRRRGKLWPRGFNHREKDIIRVTTMTSFLASEWVSFPTDATANYQPGRLPSTLELIAALSNVSQCCNIQVVIHVHCASQWNADDDALSHRVPDVDGIPCYTHLLCGLLVIVNRWRGKGVGRHCLCVPSRATCSS
jgi:hypothetical protein